MKLTLGVLSFIPCMAAALTVMPMAHADVFTATIYENIPYANDSSDLADNANSSLASASFTVGSAGIDFETDDSPSTTIAAFLNNPTFFNEVNGFDPTDFTDNSEIVITGSTYLNLGDNAFVVGHDDGVVITFPGIGSGTYGNVVDNPGPTGYDGQPFNVTAPSAGVYDFTLDYAECCGGPADLVFTVNSAPIVSAPPTTSATPEPSTFYTLGTGMLALVGTMRRRLAA